MFMVNWCLDCAIIIRGLDSYRDPSCEILLKMSDLDIYYFSCIYHQHIALRYICLDYVKTSCRFEPITTQAKGTTLGTHLDSQT